MRSVRSFTAGFVESCAGLRNTHCGWAMPATSAIRAAFSRRASSSSSTSLSTSRPRRFHASWHIAVSHYSTAPAIRPGCCGPRSRQSPYLVRSGTPTLVYCSAGLSRSPCIAAAAVAMVSGLPADEGLTRSIAIGSIGCAAGALVGGSSDPDLIALGPLHYSTIISPFMTIQWPGNVQI